MRTKKSMSIWKKKGYVWTTVLFLFFSFALHWIFGWEAFKNEQIAHQQPIVFIGI
jgi:predicted negative regulator of RcsB-dependent stress response